MLLTDIAKIETWEGELLSEVGECETIFTDIFGSVEEAMLAPETVEFLNEAGLAADWEILRNEISELIVQCEDEFYEHCGVNVSPVCEDDE